MKERQQSIDLLQLSFLAGILGIQDEKVKKCKYYDKDSNTVCAVGALAPFEELKTNVNGDCIKFKGVSSIYDFQGKYRGILLEELEDLQRIHDDGVGDNEREYYTEKLKQYIWSLKCS